MASSSLPERRHTDCLLFHRCCSHTLNEVEAASFAAAMLDAAVLVVAAVPSDPTAQTLAVLHALIVAGMHAAGPLALSVKSLAAIQPVVAVGLAPCSGVVPRLRAAASAERCLLARSRELGG